MTDPPKYGDAHIEVHSRREAILRRPVVWFGEKAVHEWPLAMLAMAVLTPEVTDDPRPTHIRMLPDGTFQVQCTANWVRTRSHDAAEGIRAQLWWSSICTDVAVDLLVLSEEPEDGPVSSLVRTTADLTIRATADREVCGPPTAWWNDWLDRLVDQIPSLDGQGRSVPVDVLVRDGDSASLRVSTTRPRPRATTTPIAVGQSPNQHL